MRRAAIVLLALVYGGGTIAAGLWAALIGEFHCYNVDCAHTDWTNSLDGWQWDVVIALALAGILAGLGTLALTFSAKRPRKPAIGLAVQSATLVVVAAFLHAAHHADELHMFWLSVVPLSGAALIYLRASRQIDGTRLE